MRKLFYLVALAMAFGACTNSGGKKVSPNDVEESETGLTWDSVTYRTDYYAPGFEGKEDAPHMNIDIAILTTVGKTELDRKIDANIARFFFNEETMSTKEFVKVYTDSLIDSYVDEVNTLYDPNEEVPMSLNYIWNETGSLMPDSKEGVISYMVEISNYLGGVHGQYNVLYLNMDAKTGKLLNADDVFNQKFMNEAPKVIEKRLMEMCECDTKEQMMEEYMLCMLGDPFVSDNNFALLKDSILFNFNAYEIAPYAVGNVEVKFSYKDLEKYMK